jgi:4-amino-4-deoxy-L-arabinose transferase-like glycosyltransferase
MWNWKIWCIWLLLNWNNNSREGVGHVQATLRCSHHSCLFSLDNSLSVLLKLNEQLKISSNNLPRTNHGIADLNTRNMEFFRLELEGIWQFEILEAQNSEFFFFFFFGLLFVFFFKSLSLFLFFFFLDQQLAFENNEIRFRNN